MDGALDPNIYGDDGELRTAPGYRARRHRVGRAAGAQRIATSVWVLPPGEGAYPYHHHYLEEEQIIVLHGRPLLRDPAGWRRLERGAVVSFPPGPEGGHQVHNDTSEPVTFLSISTNGEPDVVAYPDANRIAIFERPPSGGMQLFPLEAAVAFTPDTFPRPNPPAGIS